MLNFRGQEGAPFELLVAVIMMAFVLVIGWYAIDRLRTETCYNENEKMMEELKTAITHAVNYRNIKTINFKLTNCSKEDKVFIEDYTDPYLCQRYCLGSQEHCSILWYHSKGKNIAKCLNIATSTQFLTDCRPEEGFDLIDLKASRTEGIPEGYYRFEPAVPSAAGEETPDVCAYKRKD